LGDHLVVDINENMTEVYEIYFPHLTASMQNCKIKVRFQLNELISQNSMNIYYQDFHTGAIALPKYVRDFL
jgi:spermidine synthase